MNLFDALRSLSAFSSERTAREALSRSEVYQKKRQQALAVRRVVEEISHYEALNVHQGHIFASAVLDLLERDLSQETTSLPLLILENVARVLPEAFEGLYQ